MLDHEKEAVKAFLAHSKKLQSAGVISDQDFVTAFALSHELLADRNPSEQASAPSPHIAALSQPLNDAAVTLGQLAEAQLVHGGRESITIQVELLQTEVPLREALPEIHPRQLKNYFDQCNDYCKKRFDAGDYMEAFIFADRALKALPIVTSPFWNDVPSDQILGRLDDLKQLTAWGLVLWSNVRISIVITALEDVLISYQSWAITIRLLRRLPDLNLKGYHFVNLIPGQGPLTFQGEEGARLLIIHNYLESLKEQSSYHHGLFDFSLKETFSPLRFDFATEKKGITNKSAIL